MTVMGHSVVVSLMKGHADIDPSDSIIPCIPTVANTKTEAIATVAMILPWDDHCEENIIAVLVV